MRKILIPVFLLLSLFVFCGCTSPQNKTQADYQMIETVRKEMDKAAKSSTIQKYENRGQWYIYDMRLISESDAPLFTLLRQDLGEDFDSVLSNGDPIFVGVLPVYNKFRVYAGKPDDEHMLYPTWSYDKLDPPATAVN